MLFLQRVSMPKSMTFDDLERPKRHSCRNKQKCTEPTRKKFNEDRPILSAAECKPMILVSRNINYKVYADIRGDSSGRGRQIQ